MTQEKTAPRPSALTASAARPEPSAARALVWAGVTMYGTPMDERDVARAESAYAARRAASPAR